MKYYQPTFKIEAIISAETKEEALEKAKTVELDVEELPNYGIWKIRLKDGTLEHAPRIEFFGDHGIQIGMKHEFRQVIDYDTIEIVDKTYVGKVVSITQDKNIFHFLCEEITTYK